VDARLRGALREGGERTRDRREKTSARPQKNQKVYSRLNAKPIKQEPRKRELSGRGKKKTRLKVGGLAEREGRSGRTKKKKEGLMGGKTRSSGGGTSGAKKGTGAPGASRKRKV